MTDKYFNWLVNKVGGSNGMTFALYRLTLQEFRQADCDDGTIWANDIARCSDALSLREQYINTAAEEKEIPELETLFVSVLEVLIAFALRIENDIMYRPGEERVTRWFWEFIENLGIDITNSDWTEANEEYADHMISKFINRNYLLNGEDGNIFVADWDSIYPNDYRKMPLWTQMQSYASQMALEITP